jgi:hypothetical protein
MATTEDLKKEKYYMRYLKITFFIGFLGVVMELLKWNYLCNYQCILITFSPFLVLNVLKGIVIFYKKSFKKEAFQINKFGLLDGIWVKNNGALGSSSFNALYSLSLLFIPTFLLLTIFVIIKESLC